MKTNEIEIKTGLSKQTILYYEKEGLINPERNENGYRNYSDENLQQLMLIKLLRSMNVSIDDSDILSPLALTLRSGSFSLNATNVASINELSPYALGFCLFCYLLVYRCKSHTFSFDIDTCIIISI